MGEKEYLVMQKKISKGVVIFGVLFILTSVWQAQKFISFDYYSRVFQQLPPFFIVGRYIISIMLRVLGFSAGIGLLLRKDIARKLALGLAIFTILSLYWKHPYSVVYNYYKISFYFTQNPDGVVQFVLPETIKQYTLVTLAVFYLFDILFCSGLIYYFTRPKVKAQFK